MLPADKPRRNIVLKRQLRGLQSLPLRFDQRRLKDHAHKPLSRLNHRLQEVPRSSSKVLFPLTVSARGRLGGTFRSDA